MTVRSSTGFVQRILGPSSFESIFLNGCIEVYSGEQPSSSDLAATGALLGRITRSGGAWTEGSGANGLQFTRSGRFAYKHPAHEWRLVGLATGVAGWWRLRGNAADSGASIDLPRIDGAVRLDGSATPGELTLASLAIIEATDVVINHWWYAMPPIGE